MVETWTFPQRDTDILRRLASRKAEIARDPLNLERKKAWYQLDQGASSRPMVLAEVGGVTKDKVVPLPEAGIECEHGWARDIERSLRQEIYQFDVLKDDHVVEPCINLRWKVTLSDFGVTPVQHTAAGYDHLGSRRWDPPITDLDRDFDKLKHRTFSVNREGTLKEQAYLSEVFKGILNVRIRSKFFWSLGMTWQAIDLIGLENLMLFMFDNPTGLHRLMAFLRDDWLAYIKWLEKEGLFGLNNENEYTGSGTIGYTRDLPAADWKPGSPVRLKDLWCLSESQETVGVGPDQFEEFIFPYQVSLAELHGKVYYGCCEPVHNRWHVLKKMPNLARVSISPWADQEIMARELGTKYVFSRKPSPAMISTDRFDEDEIRADIRNTLTVAKGCRIELIMKDVHTLKDNPSRLPRWVEIAREEISRMG